jgi:hypothetical protein
MEPTQEREVPLRLSVRQRLRMRSPRLVLRSRRSRSSMIVEASFRFAAMLVR